MTNYLGKTIDILCTVNAFVVLIGFNSEQRLPVVPPLLPNRECKHY